MKVLSKYFKVALCFMAFALCSFMFAFTPTMTAVQALDLTIAQYNVAINAIKMPTEEVDYSSNDSTINEFRIPLLSGSMDKTDYTIRVVDPSGYSHDYVLGGDKNDANFFTKEANYLIVNAKNDGDYKVVYIVTNNNRTYYSNSYAVSVKNVSYELDFSTPVLNADKEIVAYTKNLMKANLSVSNTKYELPVAYAKITGKDLTVDSDGNVTNPVASIKVTKDGAPQDLNGENSVFVKINDKYYIQPKEEGVYSVEYTFENSANRPTKTFSINVAEGYEADELKPASNPTMPKMELGSKITLPKLTINAGDTKNVDVNIEKIEIVKEGNEDIKYTLTNNTLTFKMTKENFGATKYEDMVGNYHIKYIVKDAYNKTLTQVFTVDGVTVSSNPTIKLAYDFDKTATDFKTNINYGAEVELKTEYSADNEIVLPAVYVEDYVTDNYDDFYVVRAIRKGSTYYYIDNKRYNETTGELEDVASSEVGFNATADTSKFGDTTKSATFTFNSNVSSKEGTYYLEYKVISKEVKERGSNLYMDGTKEKYSFKVVAATSIDDDRTPEIEITNLKNTTVKNTAKVNIKVSSKDSVDSRLKNAVFTYTSKVSGKTESLEYYIKDAIDTVEKTADYKRTSNILENAKFIEEMQKSYKDFAIVTESETKNSFDLDLKAKFNLNDNDPSNDVDVDEISIVAVTINDLGNVATDTKVLSLKDTSDTDAPVIKIDTASLADIWKGEDPTKIGEFEIGQGKEVVLPTISVTDADKTLSLNVMYYIDKPENDFGGIEYLSPANKQFSFKNGVQYIKGGTITTSETGIYYVAYSATDVAGNTSVMYFTFEVVDTSNPILSVEAVADNATVAGNTLTAGKGAIVDFEATVKSADSKNDYTSISTIEVEVNDGGNGLDWQLSGNSQTSYKFNDYGTYTITISASYKKEVNGVEQTFKADSKIIKVIIEKQKIEWLGEFNVQSYADKNEKIYLPDVPATNGAVVKVTYQTPGSASSEAKDAVKETKDGYTYWTFTTNETSKGTYTVTYTATNNDSVLTKSFSVKVGDNVAPTLSYNKGDLTQELVYDGENAIEYVVKVNKSKKTFVVTVTNNGEEVYSYDIGLKISDRDDTGVVNSNMSWTNLSYELTGAKVTKGETKTESDKTEITQYTISGTGKYSLKLTMTDGYDNERVETINFNVVEKGEVKENKDNVVGVVLIVLSLVLLAGVILFFTFTGKKGAPKSTKTNKAKSTKEVKAEKAVKTEKVEEAEVVEEKVEEEPEQITIEETIDDEPKSGEVE